MRSRSANGVKGIFVRWIASRHQQDTVERKLEARFFGDA